MTGLPLLDLSALAVSLFNAALMLWLGLTIALNAERTPPAPGQRARPAWGTALITLSLLLGGLFFISHSALLVLDLHVLTRGLNFWWQVGWWPVLALPVAWYVLVLWYSGYWDDRGTALHRRHRRWLPLTALGVAALVLLVLFANPLPSLGAVPSSAPLSLGGVPALILAYPVYIIGCVGLALDALLRPGPTGRVLGGEARRRARPWLALGSALLLVVSLLVTWVMLWFVTRLARAPGQPLVLDSETVATIGWFDLAIAALIALAILLLGQALVAYEVFTGKTLPRRGLLRFWRNAILLSAGYALVAALSLTLGLRPIYIVLLSLALLAVSYALFSWRAYADRERQMLQLRPFVVSQQLYEHLKEQAATRDDQPVAPTAEERMLPGVAINPSAAASRPPDSAITATFHALCRDVLGARLAYLIPLGASAPLAGPPLAYGESVSPLPLQAMVPEALPERRRGVGGVRSALDALTSPTTPLLELDPAEFGGAHLALPLWTAPPPTSAPDARPNLMGLLLLGEKTDGGLYAQEEIDLARAAGERLIDALLSAELAHRLLLLQRQRLAETHIADQRTRRVLHDDVLPLLHAALLQLHTAPTASPSSVVERSHAARTRPSSVVGRRSSVPEADALELLTSAHRRLSDLLRELPAAPAPDVARLGLVDALRRLLAGELARAFDRVEWDLTPEAESRAAALPPLAADVLYSAAREALRNAARHARRPDAPLHVVIALTPAVPTGLVLTLADNGAGLDAHSAEPGDTTGQGLSLHGTLLAVLGGTITVESQPSYGTRVRLTLP